jgi:hypothetical protein
MSRTRCYGEFGGPALDPAKWAFLEMSLPDFGSCRCEEPGAKTTVADGAVEVRIEEFQRYHDTVQVFDNPKHMVLSSARFELPRDGVATFSVEMMAEDLGGNPDDYRDAFVTFNVLDMASAWVWDHAATSKRAWAIHEHLYLPGVLPFEDSISWIVENANQLPNLDGNRFHEFRIDLDRGASLARWYVDGRPTFEVSAPIRCERVQVGFGLVTLHQIRDGRSTSLRGQGLLGRFRNFQVPN